jgi:hypothetical protein
MRHPMLQKKPKNPGAFFLGFEDTVMLLVLLPSYVYECPTIPYNRCNLNIGKKRYVIMTP